MSGADTKSSEPKPDAKSKYKDSVLLPETPFPMRGDLATREPQIIDGWEKSKLYRRIQEARATAPRFVLHDGPPYSIMWPTSVQCGMPRIDPL